MGVIKRGILGGFSGAVANVVGSSWKGIAVMKSKPLSVANPRTNGQVAQRNSFAAVVAIASAVLSSIIQPCWNRFAVQASGYNDFVRTNIGAFVSGILTNFADFFISIGKMAETQISFVTAELDDYTAVITFPGTFNGAYQAATDVVYLLAYNEATQEFSKSFTSQIRSDGSASCTFENPFDLNAVIHFYLAFGRADGTVVSTSTHYAFTVTA